MAVLHSLNPAVEQQAAHRVHRIGQRKECVVHQLIARDTVEELVLRLQQEKTQVGSADLFPCLS